LPSTDSAFTANPEADQALTIYIDFKSPYAYLAVEPTRHLARELGISINWQPIVLDIPSYMGSATLDKSGAVARQSRSETQWGWVKYTYYDCRRYANLRGMTVRGTVKIWDTNLAAIGMLWAGQQGEEILQRYVDLVYVPFWKRELDVESIDVVQATLDAAGATVEGFDAFAGGEGAEQNRQIQESAFERGIFGVPSYTLGDDIYFGREHLPHIRWRLQGCRGPAPDIAYELLPGDAVERVDERTLDVAVSLEEPESYLAVQPVMDLARELDLEVRWYALPKRRSTQGPAADDESRGARHRRFRTANRQQDRHRYLSSRPSSEQEAQDTAALLAQNDIVLQDGGPDPGWAGAGYVASPVFKLDDEIFVGRQHLPLIRARFEGAH
jgi:2-hydroxychromene-2-carboxylate isomerase